MSESTSTSETWHPRGLTNDHKIPRIGKEGNLPDFVTGQKPSGDLKDHISGFVDSKEAGERIVAMFGGAARLDYSPSEPTAIQVKVGALPEHELQLRELHNLVREAGNTITPEIIEKAKTFTARDTSAQKPAEGHVGQVKQNRAKSRGPLTAWELD